MEIEVTQNAFFAELMAVITAIEIANQGDVEKALEWLLNAIQYCAFNLLRMWIFFLDALEIDEKKALNLTRSTTFNMKEIRVHIGFVSHRSSIKGFYVFYYLFSLKSSIVFFSLFSPPLPLSLLYRSIYTFYFFIFIFL